MIDSKLITFIEVAKLKSYTRAAEMLNLTQPAVTQHIKQLEEHYNVKLFIKIGRQITLTEEGELLLRYAKEFQSNSIFLERELKNKSAVIKRYNIGATLTIGEFVLPNLLGEYKKKHSNIDVIMEVHNLNECTKRLINGEFDLSIVEGPFDKNKFKYKKLKDDELVLAASPQSSFAHQESINISDITDGGKLIMRERGSGTRMVFENKLMELGFNLPDLKIYMEVGSIGALKSLVKANLGYTVISMEAVRSDVDSGALKIIPIKDVKIMREFNFIYMDHSPESFVDDFTNFLISKSVIG